MTKIAYSLLVHKNPKQVSRLITNIYSSSDFFHVIIFGNNSSEDTWNNELSKFRGINFLVTFNSGKAWGTFQLVAAMLDSMQKFDSFEYDYLINLSGQCYPLKSVDSIKSFLHKKSFAYLEQFKLPIGAPKGWGKRGGLDRLEYSYYKNSLLILYEKVFNKISKSSKYDARGLIKIHRINKQIPYKLEPYGGSMWFCLTKKHVDFILEYIKEKADLLKFFKHSLIPDELFFHTILMNSHLRDTVINDNLRYIDWSKKGVALPATLTVEDKDNLLASSKMFARKFDIELDEKILDIIDSEKGK
jgi:hypothetical protein